MPTSAPGFLESLLQPRQALTKLHKSLDDGVGPPWTSWTAFFCVAVFGSAVFGWSLSRVVFNLNSRGSAAWLTVSAGVSWLVFGPVLIWQTRQRAIVCAHACMVTMVYGEAVLILGAVLNFAAYRLWHAENALRLGALAIPLNFSFVGLANVLMACVLAVQFEGLGVSAWRTLACWMVCLNGVGALLFCALYGGLARG